MNRRYLYASIIIVLVVSSAIIYYNKFYKLETPVIGVIRIEGYMIDNYHRDLWIDAARYALENNTIKAVVLRIDSGGGSATICEDLYRVYKKLNEKKPLIVVVEGLAASGGYYVSLAGREIYATPSSLVGNIGVISVVPPIVLPGESIIETGVYKYTGFLVEEYPLKVEEIYESFVKAVNESRGPKLKVPLSTLIDGRLLTGIEAVKLGLIDEIGSYFDAIDKASKIVNLYDYKIVDINNIILGKQKNKEGKTLTKNKVSLSYLINNSKNGIGFYYIPSQFVEYDYNISFTYLMSIKGFSYNPYNTTGKIIIDLSHKNLFPYLLMNGFQGRLIEKGEKIVYFTQGSLIKALEEKPKALVIFMPIYEYTTDEIKAINKYVKEGGKLILFFDPGFGPYPAINSLAQEYGFLFSTGYLYNTKNNYGIYRNIVIRNFSENQLTRNITSLTLFTAGAIFTSNREVAWASNNTYLSIFYKEGKYAVISITKSVIAISDITFLMDPFLNITDNNKFLNNLVEWIINKK